MTPNTPSANPYARTPERVDLINRVCPIFIKIANRLGFNRAEQMAMIHCEDDADFDLIITGQAGQTIKPMIFQRMNDFCTVIARLSFAIAPAGKDLSECWLNQPNPILGNKSPVDYMKTNPQDGIHYVSEIIEVIRYQQLCENWGLSFEQTSTLYTNPDFTRRYSVLMIGRALEVFFSKPDMRHRYMNTPNATYGGAKPVDMLFDDRLDILYKHLMGITDGAIGWEPHYDYGDETPHKPIVPRPFIRPTPGG